MPYGSNSDLPPAVREKYSDRCQAVFRRVFNENHGDGEDRAFRVAHSAARRCMEAKKSVDKQPLPATKFNVFSGLLKAYDAGDGKKRIKTVASSTLTDRQGDQMTLKALQAMAQTAEGMTVFLNHSYKVPEDVFGVVKGTEITERGQEYDLDFDIEVDEDNPRALATHKSIERGVKLGTSVGAIVKDAYKDRNSGVVVIDDVALLEASIVGIPANPRSFVHYAVKALNEAEPESDEEAGFEPGSQTVVVESQKAEKVEDHPQPDNATQAREEGEDTVESPPPAESVDNDTHPKHSTTKDVENPSEEASEPEAAQEGEEPAPESAADGTTKSTEPEKKPMPASDLDSDVVGDEAKALLAMKQADFTTLLKMVETTTSELVETKKALWDAEKKVKALERERDEANANVELAKQFVNKLAELPIGRRASHSAVITDFQTKFGGIYDPDFIKMLTSGETTNG